MTSSLKKLGLPNLEVLCNADFVKKNIKFKTKKELVAFLQDEENEADLLFLKGLDQKVLSQHDHFRQEIQDYFLTIVDKVKVFREEVKKQEKIKQKEAKELKEQEIIERYLKKQALEKEQEAILERNGLAPKSKKSVESNEEIADKIVPKPKLNLKAKSKASQEMELGLEDYFRIAQQLVKEDIFQVYTDTGDCIEVQCLMMEGEKIKMILKTN